VPKGAFGVKTTPRAVRSEAAGHVTDPKTLAFRAETTVSKLQDAGIRSAEINHVRATPAQQSQATHGLKVEAMKAAEANMHAQTQIDRHNQFSLEVTRAEIRDLNGKIRNLQDEISEPGRSHAADKVQLKALQASLDRAASKYDSDIEASKRSGRDAAVAECLYEIALGVTPGRTKLTERTTLKDAQAAQNELHDAWETLRASTARGRPRIDDDKFMILINNVKDAASVNRAEWKALNDRAEKSGGAELIRQSRAGLAKAETILRSAFSDGFSASWRS
jgi:phosphotransferase system HPr-like phosphotransfer protein